MHSGLFENAECNVFIKTTRNVKTGRAWYKGN